MSNTLTVGVPVYNAMPYLKQTIDSLMQQSMSKFEILVIDDGSSDGCAEYLRTLRDPRLRVIRQENRGLKCTLNRMLEEIDTPWLVRQDADDISHPERMARVQRATEQFPDAGMFYSKAVHYQDGRTLMELQTTITKPQGLRALTQSGHLLSICHSSVVLHRQKALDLGGYRFDLHVEDYDMYWRMALAHDIQFIPEALIAARTGARGISGTNIEQQALNVLWVQYLLISHLKQRAPLPYDEAQKRLSTLVSKTLVSYRLNMRKSLDAIGERKYLAASKLILLAATSSPKTFLFRMARMVVGTDHFLVGVDPELFDVQRNVLWPEN